MSEPGTPAPADEPVDGVAVAGGAGADPDAVVIVEETAAEAPADEAVAPARTRGLRGRTFKIGLPRSRRGVFALLLVVGAFAFAGIWTGITLIHWTETADFCGRCHQMGPELYAFETGPHRDLTCGECHVEPGVSGWVKAKLNGTRQLIEVITGLYPKPIPPPEHDALPSTKDTCEKCHSLDRLASAALVARTSFSEDEANTRAFVGLLIRPGSGDTFDENRGVHWHVLRNVEFLTPEGNAEKIDYVAVTALDGTIREFIAQDQIEIAEDIQPDIDRLKADEKSQTMDCIQCHNRVGHPIPDPRRGLDYDLANSRIDSTLPYVKREGMQILWNGYPDQETAFAEADKLSSFYELEYPEVAASQSAEIDQAIKQIKLLYTLTATPDMKAMYSSYPDFMGHMDFPGCFRCHDGGHFLVKDGAVTSEVIPYTCDACHTWPQIGGAVASLPLGEPPETHDDSLYVFNHKDVATSVDPGTQSCGECHARDYCANCHNTGAVNVEHDAMATNHAQVIREYGNQSCAYCHQPVYCARCHAEPVLPVTTLTDVPTPSAAPEGILWPLIASGPSTGSARPAVP